MGMSMMKTTLTMPASKVLMEVLVPGGRLDYDYLIVGPLVRWPT